MKRTYFLFSVVIILVLITTNCKRFNFDGTWETEILVPLVRSELTLENLIGEDLVRDDGQGNLEIFYEEPIFEYKLDSLFQLPDTTITTVNQGAIIPIMIAPGQSWVSDTNSNVFDIPDIDLLEMEIISGKILFEIESNLTEALVVTYLIPPAIKGGQSLQLVRTLPAATSVQNTVLKDSIDLAGYNLDLSGKDKDEYNSIFFYTNVQLNPAATSNYNLTAQDIITVRTTYKGLTPSYARGDFHTQQIDAREQSDDFEIFTNLPDGELDIEAIELDFEIRNALGVDLQTTINEMTASNGAKSVSLEGQIISERINLDRATPFPGDPPVFVQSKRVIINEENSNLDELLEVLPTALLYDLSLIINPLGNISNGNDFIYLNTGVEIDLNATVPISFSADRFAFRDTTEFSLEDSTTDDLINQVTGGNLILNAVNGFPFDLLPSVVLLDEDQEVLDTLDGTYVIAGELIDNIPNKSSMDFPLPDDIIDKLYKTKYIIIEVLISTRVKDHFFQVQSGDKLEMTISCDFDYKMGRR